MSRTLVCKLKLKMLTLPVTSIDRVASDFWVTLIRLQIFKENYVISDEWNNKACLRCAKFSNQASVEVRVGLRNMHHTHTGYNRTKQPLIHKILNSKQYQVSQLCQLGITVRDLMECEISLPGNTKCLSRSLEGVDRMILSRVICKLQQGPRHQKQRLPLCPPLDYWGGNH